MNRDDAKDLTLSLLVIAVVLLIADCLWLHGKCARQCEAISAQASALAALEAQVNPPPGPSVTEKAKDAYERAKTATVKKYEKVRDAATAGFRAAKEKFEKAD